MKSSTTFAPTSGITDIGSFDSSNRPLKGPWSENNPLIIHHLPVVQKMLGIVSGPEYEGFKGGLTRYMSELDVIGETLLSPFHEEGTWTLYIPAARDPNRNVKNAVLNALVQLSKEFPLIPGIAWHSIAHVCGREDPYLKHSLANENCFAVGSAITNDTALHAAALVTSFMGYIQNRLECAARVRVVHGCRCDCCIEAIGAFETPVPWSVSPEEKESWTGAVFSHLVTELVKTAVQGLPFRLDD